METRGRQFIPWWLPRGGGIVARISLVLTLAAWSLPRTASQAAPSANIWRDGRTGIQVQNVFSQSQEISAFFYDYQGREVERIVERIEPLAALNIYPPGLPTLAGASYAVQVHAAEPVAAIYRADEPETGAAVLYTDVAIGLELVLPLAVKGYQGQSSLTSIMNTDLDRITNVTARLYARGETKPSFQLTRSLPPAGSYAIDLGGAPEWAEVPPGFIGWLRLSSAQAPIGAQSAIDIETSERAVYAFEAQPTHMASTRLFVPLIRRDFFGTTGIAVTNPSDEPAQVTLTYLGSDLSRAPGCRAGMRRVHGGGPVTIAGGASAVFYQGGPSADTGDPDLPLGCLGSALLESDGPGILALVHDADADKGSSAGYNAISLADAAKRVALPLFRHSHTALELTTGIQVMNVGEADAEVSLSILDPAGNRLSASCDRDCRRSVPPLASTTFYPPGMPQLSGLRGRYGSAMLESDQPLAVIVNDAGPSAELDAAIYAGIGIVDSTPPLGQDLTDSRAAGPIERWLLLPAQARDATRSRRELP